MLPQACAQRSGAPEDRVVPKGTRVLRRLLPSTSVLGYLIPSTAWTGGSRCERWSEDPSIAPRLRVSAVKASSEFVKDFPRRFHLLCHGMLSPTIDNRQLIIDNLINSFVFTSRPASPLFCHLCAEFCNNYRGF